MKPQKTPNSQGNPQKEEQSKRYHISLFQAIVYQNIWYWYKNRQIDQWNRIKNPKIIPRIYGRLISDKGTKNTEWRKGILFNKWYSNNWIFMYKT